MKYLKEILIVLLVLWIAWSNIFNPPEPEIVTEVVIEIDTLIVEVEAEPEIKWYPKEVVDSTKVNELNSLIDSLQAEMNKNIDSTGMVGEYIAEHKEVIKDSTGSEVGKIELSAVSRIPFDPLLRFRINATLYNTTTTVTNTITGGKTFWQRFGISAQTGIGMGLITKQVDLYVGVGFHFEIN